MGRNKRKASEANLDDDNHLLTYIDNARPTKSSRPGTIAENQRIRNMTKQQRLLFNAKKRDNQAKIDAKKKAKKDYNREFGDGSWEKLLEDKKDALIQTQTELTFAKRKQEQKLASQLYIDPDALVEFPSDFKLDIESTDDDKAEEISSDSGAEVDVMDRDVEEDFEEDFDKEEEEDDTARVITVEEFKQAESNDKDGLSSQSWKRKRSLMHRTMLEAMRREWHGVRKGFKHKMAKLNTYYNAAGVFEPERAFEAVSSAHLLDLRSTRSQDQLSNLKPTEVFTYTELAFLRTCSACGMLNGRFGPAEWWDKFPGEYESIFGNLPDKKLAQQAYNLMFGPLENVWDSAWMVLHVKSISGNDKTDCLVMNRLCIPREDGSDPDEDPADFDGMAEVSAMPVVAKATGARSDMAMRAFYGYSLTDVMYDPNWMEGDSEDEVDSESDGSGEGDDEVSEDEVSNDGEDMDEMEGEDDA